MTEDRSAMMLGQIADELAAIKNELADMRMRHDMLHKRQVLPLNGGVLAIRHQIGWLIVPQEDCATVLHLADGVSGHELGTAEVIRRFVHAGDTVVDLGAHIGLHTIILAHAVGPEGRVIAVEPVARTAECLRNALACNGLLDRCEVVVGAAGDINGTSSFYMGANSMLGSLFPGVDDQKLTQVRELKLDDHVGDDLRVNLVKMDVEGAELKALSGMRRLIARNPDILVIAEYGGSHVERVGIDPADWFAAFADAGLAAAFRIDEAGGTLSEVEVGRMNEWYSANILFARAAERIVSLDPGPMSPASQ